jgi:hypothetical protein
VPPGSAGMGRGGQARWAGPEGTIACIVRGFIPPLMWMRARNLSRARRYGISRRSARTPSLGPTASSAGVPTSGPGVVIGNQVKLQTTRSSTSRPRWRTRFHRPCRGAHQRRLPARHRCDGQAEAAGGLEGARRAGTAGRIGRGPRWCCPASRSGAGRSSRPARWSPRTSPTSPWSPGCLPGRSGGWAGPARGWSPTARTGGAARRPVSFTRRPTGCSS